MTDTTAIPTPRSIRVLKPSWILAYQDDDLVALQNHSVVIEGDTIVEVTDRELGHGVDVLDLEGQLVMPGLISSHTHTVLASPTRGLIEDLPLAGGEPRSYFAAGLAIEALDDDDLDALTAYNLAEILRAGCTTQVEQSMTLRQAQSYVRVARKWGVRGYPGGMVPSWGRVAPVWFRADDQALLDSVPESLAEIEENLEYARSINGVDNGRILPMMAPHGPETHTPETLRAVAAAARELGNGIHTHLATLPHDSATVKRLWGKAPVQWIEEFDFYDQVLIGAHLGGWEGAEDAEFLAKQKQFTYAHCPSGAGAGSGQALQPFIEALAYGVNTSVGLDSHSNDMVENMKLALLYGRARHDTLAGTSDVKLHRPTVWDMVRSVTLAPANGLGRSDLGRIAVGAKADLISIDVSDFLVGAGTPPREPLGNLLYANGLSVRTVMTDGVVQVLDGRIVIDDEDEIVRRGGEAVQKVWATLEAQGWF